MNYSVKGIMAIFFYAMAFAGLADSAHALGVGLYSKGGVAVSSYDYSTRAQTLNDLLVGFGFVLDTAVAKSKNFNYRLNIGYENIVDSGMAHFGNESMHRVVTYHTFGLSPYASSRVRIWLGPGIGLHCQFADQRFRDTSGTDVLVIVNESIRRKSELFLFDIGCVFGVNVHIAGRVSLSAELGIYAGAGIGPERTRSSNLYILKNINTGQIAAIMPIDSSNKENVPLGRAETQMKFSILYRIGDAYDPTDSDIQKNYRFNKEVVTD